VAGILTECSAMAAGMIIIASIPITIPAAIEVERDP
jgi:hypothetical protein